MDLLQALEAIGVAGVVFGVGLACAGQRLERSPLGKGFALIVMFAWLAALLFCVVRLTGRLVTVVGPSDCTPVRPHHGATRPEQLFALATAGAMVVGTLIFLGSRVARSSTTVASVAIVAATMMASSSALAPTRGLDWPIVGQFDGAVVVSMKGRPFVRSRCTMASCSFVLEDSSERVYSSPRAWSSEHGVLVRQRRDVLVFELLDRFSIIGGRAIAQSSSLRWDEETAFAVDARGIRSVFADENAVRRPPWSLIGASLAGCAFLALVRHRLEPSWTVLGVLISIATSVAFVALQFLQRSTDTLRCL